MRTVAGIILFLIALVLLYGVVCWMPGQGSRKEEESENGKK